MSSSTDANNQLTQLVIKPITAKKLENLVHFRWYCFRVLVMSALSLFTSMASSTFMVFAGDTPTIIGCGEFEVDNCEVFRSLHNRTSCVPILDSQFKSIQVEFNLICEDSKKAKNSISIQTLGVVLGALVFGLISDNFGRKKAIIIATLGCGIASIIAACTGDLITFTLVRSICGFFTGGLTVVQMVYKTENVPREHRMWTNNVLNYSPMMIIYALLAYFSKNWRFLSMYIGVSSFLTFLSVLPLYESPRWFLRNNEIDKARQVLVHIQKVDRMYNEGIEDEIDDILESERAKLSETDEKYWFQHLFCTWKMMSQTLTFLTGIICTSAVIYSLMYNMEKLSGSVYLNFAIIGICRWAVSIVFAVLDLKFAWFGRKMASEISILSTIFAIAAISASSYFGIGGQIRMFGTVVVSAMCAQLLNLKFTMISELYPTAVRSLAVSAASTMSRVGTMFSPQIFYLAEYAAWLPYVFILCFQIYDLVVFSIIIPETKGAHLENQLPPKNERLFGRRGRQ